MTTISSTFTGADQIPLSEGGVWVTGSGDGEFARSANTAVPNQAGQDCSAIYTGTAWGNNQSSACGLTTTSTGGGGSGPGLWVRHAGLAAKTGYRFIVDHAASNNIEVARFNAGTFTSLAVRTVASWTNADVWEFSVTGGVGAVVLTIKLNGVQQGATISDASGSGVASGSPGLGYSSIGGGEVFDNWTGSDGGAAATPSLLLPNRRAVDRRLSR